MGNLYTHIERKENKFINRLVKLKQLWEVVRSPVDYKQKKQALKDIKTLQLEINKEKRSRNQPRSIEQKYGGSFAWKAKELGLK